MVNREKLLDILYKVMIGGSYASLLMRNMDIDARDAGKASEIVYGTLRNMTLLEAQWRPFVKNVKPRTSLLLDMTAYQLFFMDDVEDYAVVNETVKLVSKGERGFVNAVCRRMQREKLRVPKGDSIADVSVRTSHPEWILRMWEAHYGHERMLRIAYADQERPTVYGRINTLKIDKRTLEKDLRYHFIDDICFTCDMLITHTEQFARGEVLVQDYSSQQVAKLLEAKKGMRVLDVCAAPGTKSQQIAMGMLNEGELVCCDLYEKRLGLVEQLMEKTGVSICRTVAVDGTKKGSFEKESFDRILIDAPCSGLGDLRHKPEIRWRLKPQDIDGLVDVQQRLLEANCEYLKVGGVLVYSTCTINRKENEACVRKFLDGHPSFMLDKELNILPGKGDGFYAARLKKT